MKLVAQLDVRLNSSIGRVEERLRLYRLARILSFSGDGYLYALMGCVAVAGAGPLGVAFTRTAVLAFLVEVPLYFVLKRTFRRRRPYLIVPGYPRIHEPSDEFSFPSGHTAAAFLVAYLVYVFFPSLALPMYLWAVAIGLSRVVLRVHFVSDIFAGALLGTGLAMGAVWLGWG
ncbi:MAG: phosphatase PAP2 family protein [Myxococcales bacterium FL481]|nr:MAG: phosphatase PAP2 family protein [Myxococcales bacterium FL481]